MPNTWTPPEAAIEHNDVTVYHTYKDGEYRSEYWFTLDSSRDDYEGDHVFDIRELEAYDPNKSVEKNLTAAIESGELDHVPDCSRDCDVMPDGRWACKTQISEEDSSAQLRVAQQPPPHTVDQLELELRAQYPWAQKDPKLSRQAQAAANLRQELALAFPGIKFSVKSASASMCTSVDYRWTLGPTGDQVRAIADKYAYGRFDAMQDLDTSDTSAYGEAVERVLGRAKYVHGQREIPEAVREQIGRLLCEAQRVEYEGNYTAHIFGQGDGRLLRDHVTEILSRTSFPLNSEIAGMVWRESGYDELTSEEVKHSGYYVTFDVLLQLPPLPATQSVLVANGIDVRENVARAGIELRFASKPSQDILDRIHAQGYGVWRWHKKGKFWYAKATDSTRAFAQSLLKGGTTNGN